MLEMKEHCEACDQGLLHDSEAAICSYECTFCPACAAKMGNKCPNCGGELVNRPKRMAP